MTLDCKEIQQQPVRSLRQARRRRDGHGASRGVKLPTAESHTDLYLGHGVNVICEDTFLTTHLSCLIVHLDFWGGVFFWTDVANKLNFEENEKKMISQAGAGSQGTTPCNRNSLHTVAVSAVARRRKKYRAESSKSFTGNIIHLCPIFPSSVILIF